MHDHGPSWTPVAVCFLAGLVIAPGSAQATRFKYPVLLQVTHNTVGDVEEPSLRLECEDDEPLAAGHRAWTSRAGPRANLRGMRSRTISTTRSAAVACSRTCKPVEPAARGA